MDMRAEFEQLQTQLPGIWRRVRQDPKHPVTVVALPSVSLDLEGMADSENLNYFEERIFYLFNMLRRPNTHLILVTSHLIPEALISYHLHLLPGVPYSHSRPRVSSFTTGDFSTRPLAAKLLDRPALQKRVRQAIGPGDAYLNCYTTSQLERQVAVSLGIPLMGPHPDHQIYGSKSRSRELFRELDIPCPRGQENLQSFDDLCGALARLSQLPGLERAVIKQNYTISGLGNAVLPLRGPETAQQVGARLAGDVRLGKKLRWDSYLKRFERLGGIVEEHVDGDPCSVQVRINPLKEVEVVSTHDELKGGGEDQNYVGCRFPAYPDALPRLHEYGRRVGQRLCDVGVVGRIDIDFLAIEGASGTEACALDINLRKSNTTLPLRTLQLLIGGTYDANTGIYIADCAEPRYYISSDKLGGGRLLGMLPEDLIDIATYTGIHYSSASHTGTVFHMLGGLSESGMVGATCIERTPREAENLYRRTREVLEREFRSYEWMI
ncbi:MAG: carboxylate-amine ligase [Candidatus Eremiobacteraeota bacterium]|nr:carboxylate-amine ligase [Candidatus Eremiobacteraeota bacterium]